MKYKHLTLTLNNLQPDHPAEDEILNALIAEGWQIVDQKIKIRHLNTTIVFILSRDSATELPSASQATTDLNQETITPEIETSIIKPPPSNFAILTSDFVYNQINPTFAVKLDNPQPTDGQVIDNDNRRTLKRTLGWKPHKGVA
jgi:hypothetical protein